MRLSLLVPFFLPGVNGQLNTLAKAAGLKYFGTATDSGESAAYSAVVRNTSEFGQITPANAQKWPTIEPQNKEFSYTEADAQVSLAQNDSQILRCHNLVWYQVLPSWVTSGSWTNATLVAALQAHIAAEVGHYKGKCYAWDVVNEALNDDGSYRSDIFYRTIGEVYIAIAFAAAAAADSSAKLYYNDYNIEFPGVKSTAAQKLVSSLKAAGVKIDGIGLESHFVSGQTPSTKDQVSNMKAFTALGVEVAVTELDVRIALATKTTSPSSAELEQQSTDYQSTVAACLQVSECVGITVWDFDDTYSWVPSAEPGYGAAALFDQVNSELVRKPCYYGVVAALSGGSSSGDSYSETTTAATIVTATTLATVKSSPATQASSEGYGGGSTSIVGGQDTTSTTWTSVIPTHARYPGQGRDQITTGGIELNACEI